ncbi:MAG: hypothetical protein JXR07_19025 [Reichenbachiella sp.]
MPKKLSLLIGLMVLLITSNLEAQKIKYKDLFPILNAKSWEEGIPKLKLFLADPKNSDNANGNLQMGLFFEDMVKKLDLISDSTQILKMADSAVIYLTKSKTLITEKELKKNDEFYQAFYRRDLRTGEFGIKISDVQLDIEKKLQSLGTIAKQGPDIYANLYTASAANDFAFAAYTGMTKRFDNISELYLIADKGLIDTLQMMADKELILKEAFDDVRNAVSKIGKKGYSPELEFQPIEKFGEDGLSEIDFFQNDVMAWEYGEWAYEIQNYIKDHIGSLKEDVIAFNSKLKAENELLKGLEITPFEDLTKDVEPTIVERLKGLDENPFPVKLFTVLIKKNEYDFITKPSLNPRMGDEDDVDYQLMMTDSLVSILDEIEKDVDLLHDEYLASSKKKYGSLVDAYGGEFGLIKFRQQYEAFLEKARSKWNEKNEYFTLKAQWGVSEDGVDSIYLNTNIDSMYHVDNKSDYFSVATMKDDSSNTYVIGMDFKAGENKGFMAMISNSRRIVWKENFEITKFKFDSTQYLTGLFLPSQKERKSAYLYSSKEVEVENLVVVSAKNVGEIAWTNELAVSNSPVEVKFNDLVKETVLYMKTEEEMENMSDGEVAYYVIDRSGKVR